MSYDRFTIEVLDRDDPTKIKAATMLAHNCTLEQAEHDARLMFGADRVASVVAEKVNKPRQDST
jgi:hypothetical protein